MNTMNMAAVNGINGTPGGGNVQMMPHATNGTNAQEPEAQREDDYELRLNTYIYDYFLKSEQYSLARAFVTNGIKFRQEGSTANAKQNDDEDGDSKKDKMDVKKPDDLPNADVPASHDGSFLLEWFSLFWDMFRAQRKNSKASGPALAYLQHQQNRIRAEQQRTGYLQSGNVPNNGMFNPNIMRMANGMPINKNIRQVTNMDTSRMNAQQLDAYRKSQMIHQLSMQREGSDMNMNGQRPRTPSSADNAPSPNKRPRLDPQFNGQNVMPNGRPMPGMQGQRGMPPNVQRNMLAAAGMHPGQMQQFAMDSSLNQPMGNQQKMEIYAATMAGMAAEQRNMIGNMQGGSPMAMNNGLDVTGAMGDMYGGQNIRPGQIPNGTNGNHALQDYQMQLMLLEQQNKKRLMMARQETEGIRVDGQPSGMPGGPNVFPPGVGMSPQGSRSGPSPNPTDQMKRGTPKMNAAGLPGSPMPNGAMDRGSPSAMGFGQMPPDFQVGAMGMGPNGVMRPPNSHPQFAHTNGQQLTPQQIEHFNRQNNGARMANANWQQGSQGQAPMAPQPTPSQQQPQPQPPPPQPAAVGTPQQRNTAMPPPPVAGAANGRPSSPAQAANPPTPSQTNKGNPKPKKEAKNADRKRPTKKNSMAVANPPASETENPPPTPAPTTPITAQHNSKNAAANQNQNNNNMQQSTSIPAPAPNVQQQQQQQQAPPPPQQAQQPPPDLSNQFGGMNGVDEMGIAFNTDLDSADVLHDFDFDSFLQDSGDHEFNIDASMAFANFGETEVGGVE